MKQLRCQWKVVSRTLGSQLAQNVHCRRNNACWGIMSKKYIYIRIENEPGSESSNLSRSRPMLEGRTSGYLVTTLYMAKTARFRICGREWLSIAISSGDRSRANSGVTICDSPFNAIATSSGLEPRSWRGDHSIRSEIII